MSAMKLKDKKTYLSFAEARKTKKISQIELSKMTGIIQADISRIENGKANPTINVLKRLAEAMEMNLNIFLEDK